MDSTKAATGVARCFSNCTCDMNGHHCVIQCNTEEIHYVSVGSGHKFGLEVC